MALTGTWDVAWGDKGKESISLNPYDGIVVPPGVLRSFQNTSNEISILMVVLGGYNVGNVIWTRNVKEPFNSAG